MQEQGRLTQVLGVSAGEGGARRVAIVAAHPDDEVIGAGVALSRLPTATVVYVTDGAPRDLADARAAGFTCREEYAAARRAESLHALSLAGVSADRTRSLAVVDQEGSSDLVELTWRVATLFAADAPTVVVTHPYEGGHPDHDATAFAVHAARELLSGGRERPTFNIVEMTSYHVCDGAMRTGAFLPGSGDDGVVLPLAPMEAELKRRMLGCFASQERVLRAFRTDHERFRPAPPYDFTRPPHLGRLFYEHFSWGLDGREWRRRAAAAQRVLRAGGAACS